MTREEAIERIKSRYDKWALDDKDLEAITSFIPELVESEDERIRKSLVEYFEKFKPQDMWDKMFSIGDVLAYLERQKNERELGFIEGEVEGIRQTYQEIKDAMSLFEPKDLTPFEFTFRDYIDSAIRYCLSGEGYQQYIKEWSADLLNLERQKDASKVTEAVDRIDKYIDEHTVNAHDMSDSISDKKYYQGWDDALGKIAGILQDVYSKGKQKEQKDFHKLYKDIAQSEWFKKAYVGKSLGGELEQKEQKPAESVSQLTVQGKGVYKICPHCKERMIRDDSKVYTSMPPQYGYKCPKCGEMEFDTVMYDSPKTEEQKSVEWTELTWKDIVELERIINNVHYDFSAGIGQESFGKEVLERFRSTKGIEYLDEAEQKYWREEEQKSAEYGEDSNDETKQSSPSIDIAESVRTGRIGALKNLLSYLKYERKSTQEEIKLSFIPCIEKLLEEIERKSTEYIKINSKEWYTLLCEQYDKGYWKGKAAQKPSEWSEEDDQLIGFIFDLLNDLVWRKDWVMSKEECLERLKSLRPQPHTVSIKDATKFGNLEYERGVKDGIQSEKSHQWKPSEEQMDILDKVYHYLWADRNATADMQDGLGDFIDELKSL